MLERFNWLHLTDLHYGQAGQRPLWPNVREAFFEDLRRLHDSAGPWHAVLFTGDLVQSGNTDEFARMETEVLGRLWKELAALGSGDAVLLAVPGNHDLLRPRLSAAVRQMAGPGGFAAVEEEFWGEPDGEYREVIDRAFTSYGIWWRDVPHRRQLSVTDGFLPGDFATTLEVGSHRLGIVGLNTTFLQLTSGDFRGRLTWDVRQLNAVCSGDIADWIGNHDTCLLLTHQGPDWLDSRPSGLYSEINPAGRFAAHLFGHMHETEVQTSTRGGGAPLRQWQGCSLFGLEKFGDPPTHQRRHGYAAGRIELGPRVATIRLWPRWATQDANGWRLVADHERCVLVDGEGTEPETIKGKRKKPKRRGRATPSEAIAVALRSLDSALLATYTKAARSLWDIIDLAGLPEHDRHLAMQHFLLRQLYLPLRMMVEPPLKDEELSALEDKRDELRLAAAGRISKEAREQPERIALGTWLHSVLSGGTGVDKEKTTDSPRIPRLVILGDPGGGKTTLLRWLATAYLLRREGDSQLASLPDAESLPAIDWLPILVRCRDLEKANVGQATLDDLLSRTLAKMQVSDSQSDALIAFLRGELEGGRALLLVDGLDEIADPGQRAAFCAQLETIARCFAQAPIIATSRIVGYREMRRRLGEGFAHAALAELAPEEKDEFIERWCKVTIADPAKSAGEAEKLQRGIHGTDRIERLTTNPMLLTTMALVQRRVGKLPNRRHKLYWEAVGVLLNWRAEVEDPMDPDEALPQLEYLAYAMCDRGVQRLRRDETLGLLEGVRRDYPNIRPIHGRTPEVFLADLERRTGLLVEVGEVTHGGRPVPTYEFRHLTFQEYLAALALVEGRFPGHKPGTTLAERVQPLAGCIADTPGRHGATERLVTENWREALRLCIVSCNDDDVNPALEGILKPVRPEEERPRAILAMLCLADEPNVSQSTAAVVVRTFVKQLGDWDLRNSAAVRAAVEVTGSAWMEPLRGALIEEFIYRGPETRTTVGALVKQLTIDAIPRDKAERLRWIERQTSALLASAETEAVGAALAIEAAAGQGLGVLFPGLTERLIGLMGRGPAAADAASWALYILSEGHNEGSGRWIPTGADCGIFISYMVDPQTDPWALQALARIAGNSRFYDAVAACTSMLHHALEEVRGVAAEALGAIGSPEAVSSLVESLADESPYVLSRAAEALRSIGTPQAIAALQVALRDQSFHVRVAALGGLVEGSKDMVAKQLLSQDLDRLAPWLDPQEPISANRVTKVALALSLPVDEVRRLYEPLAEEYGLRLEWRNG